MGRTAEGQDNGNPEGCYEAKSLTSVPTPDPNAAATKPVDFAAAGTTKPIIAPGKTTPGYKTLDTGLTIAGS